MKIVKAKAGAPLWEPQVNEMCEYRQANQKLWTRCKVVELNVAENPDAVLIDWENGRHISRDVVSKGDLREGKAPASKKDQIVRLLKTGEFPKALAMAAKFQDLGEHKDAITKGNNAQKNPDFYRQIQQDPATLVARGIAALKARYLEA